LKITANGQRVEWVRDTLSPFAYHITVPAGATELKIRMQHLSPTTGNQGRVTMTPEMLNIQWEKMLIYPAGHWSRNIMVQPKVKFPTGWQFGTALEPDLSGHVLMLEEVSEAAYRIDRMMFHLTGQESIRRVAGIRLGRVSDVTPNDPDFGQTPEEIVRYWCLRSGIEFLGPADIGHDDANKVAPFGRG